MTLSARAERGQYYSLYWGEGLFSPLHVRHILRQVLVGLSDEAVAEAMTAEHEPRGPTGLTQSEQAREAYKLNRVRLSSYLYNGLTVKFAQAYAMAKGSHT